MWTIVFVYEQEDGTMIEGTHTFDKTNTFGEVLLAFYELNADDVITSAEINFIEADDKTPPN